jgi:hypothetical protein
VHLTSSWTLSNTVHSGALRTLTNKPMADHTPPTVAAQRCPYCIEGNEFVQIRLL